MTHPKKVELMDRRTLYVDCDDTLIMHDKSEFPLSTHIAVTCNGREFVGVPNEKNILMLEKFYKLGYQVHVWSRTGESWAKAVGHAVGVDKYVTSYLTKPDYYLDDKDASEWMGPRIYRDIKE